MRKTGKRILEFTLALGILIVVLVWIFFQSMVVSELPDRPERAEVDEDAETIILYFDEADSTSQLTIEEWQNWADEHWDEWFDEPVAIADMERSPEHFNRFGRASLSPDRQRLLFSATTYAVATTISIVGIYDIAGEELRVIDTPAPGGLDEIAWTADRSYLAYTLGTARARGDHLHIVDLAEVSKMARFSEPDIISALENAIPDYETGTDQPQGSMLKPKFQDPEWKDGVLYFSTKKYHGKDERVTWKFNPETQQLELQQES